jgi:hypothetical protein
MTSHESDAAFEHLVRLRVLEPDAKRSERTRQRCRAALVARQQRESDGTASPREMAPAIRAAILVSVGLINVVYLAAIMSLAFGLLQ